MSYILEALKKAEAERHAGAVPTLSAQAVQAGLRTRPAAWRRPALWIAAAVPVLATLVWMAITRAPASAPAPVAPTAVASAVPSAPPAPVAAPAAAPAIIQPDAPPAQSPSDNTAPISNKPIEKAVSKPVEHKPAASAPAPIADNAGLGTLRDLPESIQHEIPALSIGGYIYASSKADRTVLINKRLMHEGEEIAPGFMLERLMPNGMVLNYKGYRYRSGY